MEKRDRNKPYCCVDTPTPIQLNLHEYCIEGWFLPQADLAGIQRLRLRVDGVYFDVFMGLPRIDIEKHFDDPEVGKCGFVAKLSAPRADSRVSLVAQTPTQEIVLHELQIDLSPDQVRTPAGGVASYFQWLTTYEPELFWQEKDVYQRLSALSFHPLVSVIVSSHNPDLYFLTRCVTSVLQQRYTHLELCICTDLSADSHVRRYIHAIAAEDARVRIMESTQHRPIWANYNSALLAANGELVVFLDQNDELHPLALLEVVRRLNETAAADMIYSDEDRIDYLGRRSEPAFKPDFDIDAFLSSNYLGRLVAVNRSVALHVRGFRAACDGAEDWDFLLRFAQHIGPERVQHISKPLYHRRLHPASSTSNCNSDPFVLQRVVTEHITRTGKQATVDPGIFSGSVRVRFRYPSNTRAAIFLRAEDGVFQSAVLSPNLKDGTTLYELIDCIIRRLEAYPPNKISEQMQTSRTQPTSATMSKGPGPARDSYSAPITSLAETDDDVFIFINGSLETINHFFIDELVSQAMRDECGLVTGISLDLNSRILHSGFTTNSAGELIDLYVGSEFPNSGYLNQLDTIRSVDGISHHFFATKREHLAAVGGFGSLSASRMPQLACALAQNAAKRNLRVLVTPYAIATFDVTTSTRVLPCNSTAARVKVNPNLQAFNALEVLKSTAKVND
jgi:glycosyltransferase involved in cell wall biosynthesis